MVFRIMCGAALVAASAGSVFAQASFVTGGYSENFNSMGASGTAAPTGWRHFATSFGSNSTWTTTINAVGANNVGTDAVTTAATTLTAITTPTANNNGGYNAAVSGNPADRALATAPTTVAGAIIQLRLDNNTGGSFFAGDALTISFDTIRYNSVSSANQLPGFWLFASLDSGTTWTNVSTVASPNPTITTVPNTVGVTSRSVDYVLPSNWNAGSSLFLRWVDDNATQTSPDQIIGLDNVSVVPSPGVIALLGVSGVVAGRRRR